MNDIYFEEEQYVLTLKDKIEAQKISTKDVSDILRKYEELLSQMKMSNDIAQKLQENLIRTNSELKNVKKATA